MKIFKKIFLAISIVLLFMLIPVVISDLGNIYTVQAASVKISKTKVTIYKGEKYTLKINGTSKKAKWSSSNKKIAIVDSNGEVTAKKDGTATITAKVGKKSYKCKVTVETKMTQSKALSIGKKLYKKAYQYYWASNISYNYSKIYTIKGIQYCKVTTNMNNVKKYFSTNGFKRYLKNNGYVSKIGNTYYRVLADRGGNIFYIGNTLEIKQITSNKIVFTSIEKYIDSNSDADPFDYKDSDIVQENKKFVIVKENNEWKIDSFTLPD